MCTDELFLNVTAEEVCNSKLVRKSSVFLEKLGETVDTKVDPSSLSVGRFQETYVKEVGCG